MEESDHTYEVFLCFRGRDTCSSFVSHLYGALTDAGIRAFKDNDELNCGGPIADEYPRLRAMENSEIYMPIFSENYASSKWCLQELAEMVSAKEEIAGKEILPIFYKVTADDVKLKTDLYMKQLIAYKTREASETVQLWKKALLSIPDCRAWELLLKDSNGDAELCQEIVKRVLVMIKLKQKLVPEVLVGIDDQEESLMKLLDIESHDVKVIGIHGMGGIGKTTLAKVVFNELCGYFDYSSFLPDIRDTLQDNGRSWHLKLLSVRSLTIKDCRSLERLPDLSELRNLTKMTLQKCEKLSEIQGLEELQSVKHLVVQDCSSLESLPKLSNLRLLERLHIEKCKKLKEVDGLESVFLKYLHISYCNSLEQLGINPLEMNRLEYVCIEFCNSLRRIRNVSGSPQLLKNNSEINHCQMSFCTLPLNDLKVKATGIGSISSLAEQDSDSSSAKEDRFAAQCSVAGLDDHHLLSSSDEVESGRPTRFLARGSSSNSKAAAAKTVLKGFFTGGIEKLAGSVDLVPVVAAAKALSQVEEHYFWDEFCSEIYRTSSSYKEILESIEAAESAHARYAKLKESAVEIINSYRSVKSQMDQVQATKEKALSEIDTLRDRLVELENTVVQANQQLQIATTKRHVLVTAMKLQVGVMRATQEEIQLREAERDASHARLNSLKVQWDSWAAHLDLVD